MTSKLASPVALATSHWVPPADLDAEGDLHLVGSQFFDLIENFFWPLLWPGRPRRGPCRQPDLGRPGGSLPWGRGGVVELVGRDLAGHGGTLRPGLEWHCHYLRTLVQHYQQRWFYVRLGSGRRSQCGHADALGEGGEPGQGSAAGSEHESSARSLGDCRVCKPLSARATGLAGLAG